MKKMDLVGSFDYDFDSDWRDSPGRANSKRSNQIMKTAIRIFALSVVVAGAAAASLSSTKGLPSHQSATASNPIPLCGPGIPCGPNNATR